MMFFVLRLTFVGSSNFLGNLEARKYLYQWLSESVDYLLYSLMLRLLQFLSG